jgi:hypothetical protein
MVTESAREEKILDLLRQVEDETGSSAEREKYFTSAIMTLVQLYCGIDDVINSITIRGEDATGDKYVIKIVQD